MSKYGLPDGWIFREGTHDAEIARCVCSAEHGACDEYGIGRLNPGHDDVFLDIGAHIGCASWMAYRQGFLNIAAYEASWNNFQVLRANLSIAFRRGAALPVSIHDCAVWGNLPTHEGALYYQPSSNLANTGGGDVLMDDGEPVLAIPFDDVVRQHVNAAGCGNLYVKLDCESSEFVILMTSRELHRVHWVACEVHELGPGTFHEKTRPIPEWAAIPGYESWTGAALQLHLERHGFTVRRNHEAENIGKLFAVRE